MLRTSALGLLPGMSSALTAIESAAFSMVSARLASAVPSPVYVDPTPVSQTSSLVQPFPLQAALEGATLHLAAHVLTTCPVLFPSVCQDPAKTFRAEDIEYHLNPTKPNIANLEVRSTSEPSLLYD